MLASSRSYGTLSYGQMRQNWNFFTGRISSTFTDANMKHIKKEPLSRVGKWRCDFYWLTRIHFHWFTPMNVFLSTILLVFLFVLVIFSQHQPTCLASLPHEPFIFTLHHSHTVLWSGELWLV